MQFLPYLFPQLEFVMACRMMQPLIFLLYSNFTTLLDVSHLNRTPIAQLRR
jgi:hypothetical protein